MNHLQNSKTRLPSIDILRGIVMLFMLVDHVRERFFLHAQVLDPMDIQTTSPDLYFTRLSAHFCAPIFVFLTGLSAWLYENPANGAKRSAQSFLLKRGLFLILLEMTLVNFSWFGAYQTLYLQVIWAIGVSMVVLAIVVALPRSIIAILGISIVAGHNLLSPIEFAPNEMGYSLWTILHDRGYLVTDAFIKVKASYPVLPWIGVILCGYAVGPLFSSSVPSQKRKTILLQSGTAFLLGLLILRGLNIYGETLDWSQQATLLLTVMDFFNFTKYPPSLDFILLTLGVGAFVLAVLETSVFKVLEPVRILGSAPMFFYITHLYALLVASIVAQWLFGTNMHYGSAQTAYFGFYHVWQVWLFAMCLSVLLYPLCKWFASYKRKTSARWVKYF
ncbi:DUF1624 domain-containing protein [Pseudoalteromonas phenolica]|uniref:Membrane protein n=1 Tax=Pseudoalteromonas phenolica TaxID=161398 RepID=A0A0S2K406_9GAMM|nr:heparan-alpha-glucosaminide N-acetyltransferase domain-containing protein [Pseudoalteromonas phenolica]ALO42690.1 membrane protein [Pseudoalteromonas phenolica]MBE0356203.1 hypothetical protein [Pseudoalteromonas phenolica O-BC30]